MEAVPTPLKDPRLYVHYWLGINNVTINHRGELVDKQRRNSEDLFCSLWLDYTATANAYNAAERQKAPNLRNIVRLIPEKDMEKALHELIGKTKATFREQTYESLKCETEDLSHVGTWVEAVTGSKDPKVVAIVSHFAWLAKRKMAGLPVKDHILPVLFGGQGSGKTTAVEKLCSPLEPYRLNLKVSQLKDDRLFLAMSENFLVVFDEMQGADNADMNVLKNQITTPYNDWRPMRTNRLVKVKQNCSFIGTTNKPLSEQVYDVTGVRRFFQIDTQERCNWDAINALDYVALWKGIDERKEDGYMSAYMEEIKAAQAEWTAIDPIDQFLLEYNVQSNSAYLSGDLESKKVTSADMYKAYRQFCESNGIKPSDSIWLGRRLSNKGVKTKPAKVGTKTCNTYFLNPDCYIRSDEELLAGLTNVKKMAR